MYFMNLSRLMAEKIEEPILHVNEWLNGRIEITVVKSYSHMIHGYSILIPLQDRDLDW